MRFGVFLRFFGVFVRGFGADLGTLFMSFTAFM
jgi:hypothetical protein